MEGVPGSDDDEVKGRKELEALLDRNAVIIAALGEMQKLRCQGTPSVVERELAAEAYRNLCSVALAYPPKAVLGGRRELGACLEVLWAGGVLPSGRLSLVRPSGHSVHPSGIHSRNGVQGASACQAPTKSPVVASQDTRGTTTDHAVRTTWGVAPTVAPRMSPPVTLGQPPKQQPPQTPPAAAPPPQSAPTEPAPFQPMGERTVTDSGMNAVFPSVRSATAPVVVSAVPQANGFAGDAAEALEQLAVQTAPEL